MTPYFDTLDCITVVSNKKSDELKRSELDFVRKQFELKLGSVLKMIFKQKQNNILLCQDIGFSTFMTEVPIIYKLVHCFAEKVNGLISI